jgi:hypothetical protein
MTVVHARLAQAVAAPLRSESRHWLDEAGKALSDLAKLYEG